MKLLWDVILRSFIPTFLLAASLLGVAGRNSENSYVDPQICSSCHLEQQEGYQETGMARSISEAVPFLSRILDEEPASFYHPRSDRHYTVFRRDARYFLRRHQIRRGKEVNQLEKRIDLVIGSGNNAATLVHRSEQGRLLELPLTWYSASGGYWAMSPGYDSPDHFGFRRKITDKCQFCHSAYPQTPGLSDIGPIDCQRCHGPGKQHLQSVSNGAETIEIRDTIINPARLAPARALEACLQCHLETTSRPLPDSLLRHRRGIFSYRPGEPLGNFKVYFDHPDDHSLAEKFEVNSAGYRFLKSSCFQASRGEFQCISCHNPHRHYRGEEMEAKTRRICLDCHESHLSSLPEHQADSNCATCHMPKRRAEDAVHVVVTDHAIPRHAPEPDAPGQQDELENARRAVYRGKVVPFYPPDFPSTAEDRLHLALAQVKDEANLDSGLSALERLIRQIKPKDGYFYLELAKAQLKSGDRSAAVESLEKSLELNPLDPASCQILGELLLQEGNSQKAIQRLEACRDSQSFDAALETTLAIAYGQRGHIREAIEVLVGVLDRDPDRVSARMNLGTALEHQGALNRAVEEYRSAVTIQPDFGLAHLYLANVLSAAGEKEDAIHHFRQAEKLDPTLGARVDEALQRIENQD